jgi:hypothetical protein
MRHRNKNKLGTGGPEIELADHGYSGNGLSEFSRHAAAGPGDTPRLPRKYGRIIPKAPRSATPRKRRKRIPATPIAMIDHHTKLLGKLRDKLASATNIETLAKIRRRIEVKSDYIARLHAEFVESRQ